MYDDLDAIFKVHVSGTRAQQLTAKITEYYRSPGSPGYHAATAFVAHAIGEAGAEHVTEERYPSHVLTLARGFERAGLFTLNRQSRAGGPRG